jgi:hypothetical protein
MGSKVQAMFEEWGIKLLTEREEKQQPAKPRGRKKINPDTTQQPSSGSTHFRYEYLIDGLFAYVTRDAQVKTTKLLQDEKISSSTPNLALEERVTEIGSEFCRRDFVWVCHQLNAFFQTRYKQSPRWTVAIQSSDNFFIPLLAALGWARNNSMARLALENRKQDLLQMLEASDEEDPLGLTADDADSLESIQKTIKSNIGRKQRALVFNAWQRYFMLGALDRSRPIDWRTAAMSE